MSKYPVQPFSVIGPDKRPTRIEVEIFDQVAWDATSVAKRDEMFDAAMFTGTIEYHKRWPIATIRRVGDARLGC